METSETMRPDGWRRGIDGNWYPPAGWRLTVDGNWHPPADPVPMAPLTSKPKPKPKKKLKVRHLVLIGGFALVGAFLATKLGNSTEKTKTPTASPVATAPVLTPTPAPAPAPSPAPSVTVSQRNAVRQAQEYLDTQAFSRAGLIDQLDSPYGGQFSQADATYAVDSQNVDWNAQAAKAAKEYLATQPFSHAGLVAQLDSPYGGKFTAAQAEYGVTAAGL
jgi:hypothetical protein